MSGVLILSTDKKKAILTKQFLYPIHIKVKEPILKIVAEKMDVWEWPMETAIFSCLCRAQFCNTFYTHNNMVSFIKHC